MRNSENIGFITLGTLINKKVCLKWYVELERLKWNYFTTINKCSLKRRTFEMLGLFLLKIFSSIFQKSFKYCLYLENWDSEEGSQQLFQQYHNWRQNSMYTAQKMKFSIKDFFSKCDKIRIFLRIWSHVLKKSLMENFIFLCSFCEKKQLLARSPV